MKPSFVQIAIVILIIVIIFGAPKLPALARSLGQSMKIFKSEVKDLRDDDEPKKTEPGELNREASENDNSSTAEAARQPEQAAQEKQDPQSREK
ncbi:Sec-independent protein translocase subunit TatA [Brevibacterium sp. UCMA 11752]|uniref:Sec-independent protein translocase subunit TatA n=1 Tax=Brevibacterium sp. UCMA 11752 TaxID=2745946 RepID=UPI001F1C5062|nr:Sec-independent protein translocase subunit TatA [Brevibacterium sp. UCMA 11752]MCF2588128.1 Sec-independent protein translocase subunit TatA [Brevibacterium sp. UCMA 11752]